MMTKEVEVGDEYTGKVVKTTTFGAFVELSKGTDGLLHISNVSPGQRAESVEDVLNRGDEIDVRVVEVDKERGRIGLRLADDPEIQGKTAEELASVGTGDKGGGRRPRRSRRTRRRPRWPRRTRRRPRRGRGRAAAAAGRRRGRRLPSRPALRAAEAHGRGADTHRAGLGRPGRDGGDALRPVRGARVLDRRGLAQRDPEQAGISHFLEHLLFKGTDRFSSVEIDQIFDGMGAEINAGTGKETTSVYSRFLDMHLERAFDVMADMVLRPSYPDIDSERQVVIEEIAMYEDEPSDKVHDVLSRAVFGDHPLGRPIIGKAEVIGSVPVPDIAAYHDEPLRAVERGHRRRRAAWTTTSSWHSSRSSCEAAGSGRPDSFEPAPRDPSPTRSFYTKETEQYHLCLGAPGIARGDERRFALRVLDTILGGSTSSRLFQEVREKRGLAYSVYSYSSQYVDSGQVGIYVGTRPDSVGEAMDVIGTRAAPARRGRVSDEELDARQGEREGPHRALDGVHARAHEPHGQLGAHGRPAAHASTRSWPPSTP